MIKQTSRRSSRNRSYGVLGACFATAALATAASPILAADVELLGASGWFYRFGAGAAGPDDFGFYFQGHGPAGTSQGAAQGVAASVASELRTEVSSGPGLWRLEVSDAYTLSAAVGHGLAGGYAEVGGGLEFLSFALRVTGGPAVYLGSQIAFGMGDSPDLVQGTVLLPGDHAFLVSLGTLPIDSLLTAAPGQSLGSVQIGRTLEFQFEVQALPCIADWDGDGAVNSSDISAFLVSWLVGIGGGSLEADFNSDGQVDSSDISAFLTAWLDAVQNGC